MIAVPTYRVQAAKDFGLENVDTLALVVREVGLQFYAGCALMEQESNGRNAYGHDAGGALSGYPKEVNKDNFDVFHWMVFTQGQTSNGVGPCQLTFKGFFADMERQGLKPWDVHDNMHYGLSLLKNYHDLRGNWVDAGAAYNGKHQYGVDFDAKVTQWMRRFGL